MLEITFENENMTALNGPCRLGGFSKTPKKPLIDLGELSTIPDTPAVPDIPAAPVPPDTSTALTIKGVQKTTYFSDDRSRHRKLTDIKPLSDDPGYTKKAVEKIGETLDKLRTEKELTNLQLLHHLDHDIYPSESTISRIINNNKKRPPSAAQLIELRRVFGVDLNALADGDNPFVLERQSDICLIDLLHQISEELLRRKCQE